MATLIGPGIEHVDVVIVTALGLEFDAVLAVSAGAWPGSEWADQSNAPADLPLRVRDFTGHGGRRLRIAVAQAGGMGAPYTAARLAPLAERLRPRCVAMTGVCAGRPGKTRLGDVIAADRLFFHDTGKQTAAGVEQDLAPYPLPRSWAVALERFDFLGQFREASWWLGRPTTREWQELWVLAQLLSGAVGVPPSHERETNCPLWVDVVRDLVASRAVTKDLRITKRGRDRVRDALGPHDGRLPDLSPRGLESPFKVHVAPIGSGNKVIEDQRVWGHVSAYMRKTLGIEMEAAAVGIVADQLGGGTVALVMKGVMDFANHGRDDHFKEYAARASAECLTLLCHLRSGGLRRKLSSMASSRRLCST